MQQRRDHPVVIGPVAPCAGGRLHRMAQTCYLISRQAFIEINQGFEQSIRRAFGVFGFMGGEKIVIFFVTIFHLGEFDLIHDV